MAVRLGVGRDANSDIAAAAGAVLDHDCAVQCLSEVSTENAGHDVGRPAGSEGHDDFNRTFRIVRGARVRCGCGRGGECDAGSQDCAA